MYLHVCSLLFSASISNGDVVRTLFKVYFLSDNWTNDEVSTQFLLCQ
jgi:hypothetical protein